MGAELAVIAAGTSVVDTNPGKALEDIKNAVDDVEGAFEDIAKHPLAFILGFASGYYITSELIK